MPTTVPRKVLGTWVLAYEQSAWREMWRRGGVHALLLLPARRKQQFVSCARQRQKIRPKIL